VNVTDTYSSAEDSVYSEFKDEPESKERVEDTKDLEEGSKQSVEDH